MGDSTPPGSGGEGRDGDDAARSAAEVEAAERGRAMVAEARSIRRRMLDDAEQRRQALVAELERVRAGIDAAIDALKEPVSTAGAPSAVPPAATQPSGSTESPEPSQPSQASEPSESREPRPSERPRSPGQPDASESAARAPERPPERVEALFDSLRNETPPPPSKRSAQPKPRSADPGAQPRVAALGAAEVTDPVGVPVSGPTADVPADATPRPAREPAPSSESLDAAVRRRDAAVEPLVPEVMRASKRLLQDEQNSLLDAARRARGRHEPSRLLSDPVRQRETWTALLAPAIDAAYLGGRAASGKSGRVTKAPERLVVELAALLVSPLRERVSATIEAVVAEGPYDSTSELQRALGSAIGARFREWRAVNLEEHLVDVLAAAYARGAYDAAAPAAMLRWIPAEPGHCPDCDDNALEPTLKGKAFPTGQPHPPAHPGCRCVLIPADA